MGAHIPNRRKYSPLLVTLFFCESIVIERPFARQHTAVRFNCSPATVAKHVEVWGTAACSKLLRKNSIRKCATYRKRAQLLHDWFAQNPLKFPSIRVTKRIQSEV